MTAQQFQDVFSLSVNMLTLDKTLRRGQALVNALHVVDFESYESIVNSPADCFYDDERIPKFTEELYFRLALSPAEEA